ncbi:OmpA family protein [Vreelandella venusta]|uniref:OmpA family protein n=1 Tax=Vreelandella venusta TaxID=44935 RepID=UPI0018DA906B|nr:OmpA family protein [Halomonas venusta]QPI63443.1 OmpA family protein [Halomonas venusta]
MKQCTKPRTVIPVVGIILAVNSSAICSAYAEGFPDVRASPEGLGESFLRSGTFMPLNNLRKVNAGAGRLTQQDVKSLLGPPSSPSAVDQEEDSWIYNINLPLHGESYLVCQYQMSFSQQVLTSSEWRRPQCERFFAELSTPVQPQEVSFSTDFLFGFDSYAISSQDRSELQRAIQSIQAEFQTPTTIVTGHTDRIGSAEYNLRLSEHRAKAVADALVEGGGSPHNIRYTGMGQSDPLVSCQNIVGAALKECLAPNRRVEILLQESI